MVARRIGRRHFEEVAARVQCPEVALQQHWQLPLQRSSWTHAWPTPCLGVGKEHVHFADLLDHDLADHPRTTLGSARLHSRAVTALAPSPSPVHVVDQAVPIPKVVQAASSSTDATAAFVDSAMTLQHDVSSMHDATNAFVDKVSTIGVNLQRLHEQVGIANSGRCADVEHSAALGSPILTTDPAFPVGLEELIHYMSSSVFKRGVVAVLTGADEDSVGQSSNNDKFGGNAEEVEVTQCSPDTFAPLGAERESSQFVDADAEQ